MRKHTIGFSTFIFFALGAVGVTLAATPKEVVERHIASLQKANVDKLVSDYASDAVIVLPMGSYTGLVEIRKMFETYFQEDKEKSYLAWDATAEPRQNGMVVEHWTFHRGKPNQSSGTDIIVVRDGKIVFHTMGPDAACKKP